MTGMEKAEHAVTSTDELVYRVNKAHPGTVARCICGWSSAWGVRDGSAEADGAQHMSENVKGYAEEREAHYRRQREEYDARMAAAKAARLERLANTPLGPQRKPFELCHPCTCFLDPPCSQCEHCNHSAYEITDCDNDCQNCEEDHDN